MKLKFNKEAVIALAAVAVIAALGLGIMLSGPHNETRVIEVPNIVQVDSVALDTVGDTLTVTE